MRNLFTRAPAVFTGAAALLAGGLFAAPASAQGETESMMTLGGYTNYTVSFTKHPGGQIEEQEGDIYIYNNTEIFFNGSAETDGGLQVSARVELEGSTQTDQIDEHYITVSGGFGSLEVGSNDSADERTAIGYSSNITAVDYWYSNAEVVPGGDGGAGYRGIGQNDGMGLNYTTPSLGGATFAISYKPSTEGADTQSTSGDANLVAFGAKYSGDMDGITVGVSFGYHQHEVAAAVAKVGDEPITLNDEGALDFDQAEGIDVETPEKDVQVWGIGVEVGFGDTTIYARYQDEEEDPEGDVKADELEIAALAISHVVGPTKLGLGWVQAKSTVQEVDALQDTMVLGAVDYTLGAGVVLGGYVAWGEVEDQSSKEKESGTALGVALNLAF